jgi:hypothetical protein
MSILNIYVPNTEAPIYIKKKTLMALRALIYTNTLIVGDLIPHCHQWIGLPNKRSAKKLQSYSTHYTK